MKARQRWTACDDAILRAEYPSASVHVVAATLGRSFRAVYQRAQAIGVRKDAPYQCSGVLWVDGDQVAGEYQEGATVNELARRYGVHRETMAAHLRRLGCRIRGTRATARERSGRVGSQIYRQCTACNQWMPHTREFYARARGGLRAICLRCMADEQRQWARGRQKATWSTSWVRAAGNLIEKEAEPMSTDLIVAPHNYVSEYAGMGAADLRIAVEALLTVGAETFARMAAIVQVADEQGVTAELGLQAYQVAVLRRIGRGEILPQAYARFGGTPLERHLAAVTPAEQRALCEGGTVTVYSFDGGKVDERHVPPLKLTAFERQQVFGRHGLRDAPEQRSWLESRRKQRRSAADGTVVVDHAQHAIHVRVGESEVTISRDALLDYLKQI